MCNVEVAQVSADPLKIISLSRDLFFSFVPGLLSRAGRSPAAQAAQAGPARLSGVWGGMCVCLCGCGLGEIGRAHV